VESSALDRLTTIALRTIAAWTNGERPAPPDAPAALMLLLRRYAQTGQSDLSDVLGAALPLAIELASAVSTEYERASWLEMFTDARRLSEDARIDHIARELRRSIVRGWPSPGPVQSALHAVDSVLSAASDRDDEESGGDLVAAIDELERVVGAAYAPGAGIAHEIGPSGADKTSGTLADHTSAAAALLTACSVSGRVPYAMLADELMQFASRTWRDASAASTARVFARLGALYADDEYRRTAVLADVDYADAARQLLPLFADHYERCGGAGECGLAMIDAMAELRPPSLNLRQTGP
jgi:hypothetical protein